jgi:dolichyl-diphosphooligosaccharide--protein glycosyltransferase
MADQLGTRYVITDAEMDSSKFWAMATWFNNTAGTRPYMTQFAVTDPAQPASYQDILLYNQTYYHTMISRLHNFDGSLTEPQKIYYLEYIDPAVSRLSVPVITNAELVNATDARTRITQYTLKAPEGYHAIAMSPALYLPVDTVPALHHYRLVHESPTNIYAAVTPDTKYVKVFEYVKGARIRGEGVIEVPVTTNTGRSFIYRQQSENGEFIVPYSTTGTPYDVKTTGKYRIAGTNRQFDVSEDAVMQGLTVR